jgi:AbrB family looped-hinge helix DNA binding protein
METTVDRFGRVVIPKKIRDDHNLGPGTQVRIEEKEDAIILIPVRGEQNLQWKNGVLVYTGVPMGDLVEAVTKHRKERARSLRRLK